jgi:hypothetical protein
VRQAAPIDQQIAIDREFVIILGGARKPIPDNMNLIGITAMPPFPFARRCRRRRRCRTRSAIRRKPSGCLRLW